MIATKTQSWIGLAIAGGAAVASFTNAILPMLPPDPHVHTALTIVAAIGAAIAAGGQSILPRNGAHTRAADFVNEPKPTSDSEPVAASAATNSHTATKGPS